MTAGNGGGGGGGGGRHIGEVLEDSMLAVKGFVETVGAIGWCLVLLVLDYLSFFFPKRKSFRGETILITGTYLPAHPYVHALGVRRKRSRRPGRPAARVGAAVVRGAHPCALCWGE